MRNLVRFFSFNSYVIVAALLGVDLAAILARGGLTLLEGLLLLAYAALAVWLWLRLRTTHRQIARFDSLAAFDRALRDNRPTLLALYSDHCGVCLVVQPAINRLEQEVGQRLQFLRVDVKDSVGLQIADRYGVAFTPTFLLFNSYGVKEEEFTLALDRPAVLYWLDQQTVSP